ncbi:MAG: cation transporter, partial [Bacilli bacterium]|nr:cation transporter [Bacilli bacterium]
PSITQLHGFYIDEARKFVNFDIVVSFDVHNTDQLTKDVMQAMLERNEDYTFFINVDRDY